jgi:hypothetical protein
MTKGLTSGLRSVLLRFAVAAALIGTLTAACQAPLLDRLVPLFHAWLDLIDDTFRTVELGVVRVKDEDVIRRTVTPAKAHVVGATVVGKGDGVIQSDVAAGLALQPIVVGLACALAWPWRRGSELAWRLAIAFPLIVLVTLLDVPMILYAAGWDGELRQLDPEDVSALVQWGDLMNSGGRFMLACAAAALAIGCARTARA